MGDNNMLSGVGLDGIEACLRQKGLPWKLLVGPVETNLGRWDEAGARGPLPSSMARLEVDEQGIWIPAPMAAGNAANGEAPIYLHGGAE